MREPSWSLGCALTVNPNFTSSSPLVIVFEEENYIFEGGRKRQELRRVERMKIKMRMRIKMDDDGREIG